MVKKFSTYGPRGAAKRTSRHGAHETAKGPRGAAPLMKHWCKYAFSGVEIELNCWSLNWRMGSVPLNTVVALYSLLFGNSWWDFAVIGVSFWSYSQVEINWILKTP